MKFEKTKGIVLKAIPLKDRQKILTVFSQDLGICSILLKNISTKKAIFTNLFCEAEFVFSKKNSDLLLFQEGSIVDLHLPLRNSLRALQTAGSIAKAVLENQFPGRASPALYALFSSFLKNLHLYKNKEAFLGCFYLKMLLAEGSYSKEALEEDPLFSEAEKNLVHDILLTKKFSDLEEKPLSKQTLQKIEANFSRLL